ANCFRKFKRLQLTFRVVTQSHLSGIRSHDRPEGLLTPHINLAVGDMPHLVHVSLRRRRPSIARPTLPNTVGNIAHPKPSRTGGDTADQRGGHHSRAPGGSTEETQQILDPEGSKAG